MNSKLSLEGGGTLSALPCETRRQPAEYQPWTPSRRWASFLSTATMASSGPSLTLRWLRRSRSTSGFAPPLDTRARPGVMPLSHLGVLFLDELPEFPGIR